MARGNHGPGPPPEGTGVVSTCEQAAERRRCGGVGLPGICKAGKEGFVCLSLALYTLEAQGLGAFALETLIGRNTDVNLSHSGCILPLSLSLLSR